MNDRARRRRGLAIGLEVLTPLALLVLWGVLSARSTSPYFPPLVEILATFQETWLFDRVPDDVLPSLGRLLLGYVLSVAAAVVVGVMLGSVDSLRRACDPVVQFLRAIPPPILLPLGLVVLGVGDGMKVAIIAFVCFWPVLLNTVDGVAGVDPAFRETARSYRIPAWERLTHVTLRAASPQIFAGARVSLALAIIMMVVSEMMASTNGIGYFVLQSQRTYAIPEMWSGIILLAILGFLLNLGFLLVERRVLRWHRGARAGAG